MRDPLADWRLWIALGSLMLGIGWLDVVRGRELAIVAARQQWVVTELERVKNRLERLETLSHPR